MRLLLRLASVVCVALVGVAGPIQARPEIAFNVTEGQNLNSFVRQGPVAAHLLLRSGNDPRILVAFPAGNSGVGLWFDHTARAVRWRIERDPVPISRDALHGIVVMASVDASALSIKQAVLSNVRYLRDYQAVGTFPPEVAVTPIVKGGTIEFRRPRLDGAPGYQLTLRVLAGRIEKGRILASGRAPIRLEITALTGDTPLTPLPLEALLNAKAAADPAARKALSFLSYREKFLAGSWRFNTYFGRDTLMSVRLLMPALKPAAAEAGLNSVFARLNPTGEVAHEEGLAEFAIMEHRRAGERGNSAELDYQMVDDDYMLAPVVATYLLDYADPARARAYLAGPVASEARQGTRVRPGDALARNLRFVLSQARPFADRPEAPRLIALKPNRNAGQWRDSDEGIGRGRFAYDVNAVFVPAALDAARRLLASKLLDPYLSPDDRAAMDRAGAMANVWRANAPPLFRVSIPVSEARPAIRNYAGSLGVPAATALNALGDRPMVFHAISLDARGTPIPIVHSDEGFALLFGDPAPADLERYVLPIMQPFPAGLMTDVGLLVANAAFVDEAAQARFKPTAYHGAVIWSWQQALLAAGFERQIARRDLPARLRTQLLAAQSTLWRAIAAAREVQSSELWSWAYRDGKYEVVPFGAGRDDVDESNAAQLWSTVYLAVRPPSAVTRPRKSR